MSTDDCFYLNYEELKLMEIIYVDGTVFAGFYLNYEELKLDGLNSMIGPLQVFILTMRN